MTTYLLICLWTIGITALGCAAGAYWEIRDPKLALDVALVIGVIGVVLSAFGLFLWVWYTG